MTTKTPGVQAYPLHWPPGFPRRRHREKGKFAATLPSALASVQDSLRLFAKDSGKALSGTVISSNYSLGNERPDDPGVAVYFIWDDLQVCIPVDRYDTIAGNLRAIYHVIEARRVELRHGTLALVRASFTGFAALPPPDMANRWQAVLGVRDGATIDEAEAAFRQKARDAHPDRGGSHAAMAALTVAISEARKELA